MHIPHKNATPVYETVKAKGYKLLETEATEYVELTLLKGGNVPSHSLNIPVTFYIAEGEGILAINDNEITVNAGDMANSEAGATRELRNTGEGNLRVLVIKHKENSICALKGDLK